MALKTDAAESSEISCSPLRPPKRMPTRSFFIVFQCGRGAGFPSIAGVIPFEHEPAVVARFFRPVGAEAFSDRYPGLAPWAAFFRRFAAEFDEAERVYC